MTNIIDLQSRLQCKKLRYYGANATRGRKVIARVVLAAACLLVGLLSNGEARPDVHSDLREWCGIDLTLHDVELALGYGSLIPSVLSQKSGENGHDYGGESGSESVVTIEPANRNPNRLTNSAVKKCAGLLLAVVGFLVLLWGSGTSLIEKRGVRLAFGLLACCCGLVAIVQGLGILIN